MGTYLGADLKKNKYWTIDDDTHTLVIGTTRAGKSRRIIMPTIHHLANMGESMVICDLKKELYPATKDFLHRKGYKTPVLDLRTPQAGNRWNLLHPVLTAIAEHDTAKAIQFADDIAYILSYDPKYRGDPIWPAAKRSLISSLILAVAFEAAEESKHMGTVYHLLSKFGADGGELLDFYINSLRENHPAKIQYGVYQMSTGKMRSSIATDTLTTLQIFAIDPAVAYMLAKQDHDLAAPGKEKTAVFLVIPDERSNRNVLASLYIQQSYSALVDLANQNNRRVPIRVNYLLDEFGNIPAITDFSTKITTAGGRGLRFTLALQGLDQLSHVYPGQENTITGQCWTWIYILTSDIKTADLISQKTGQYTVATESYSSTAQRYSHSEGVSQGLTGRPLVMKDEVLRWPEDTALILRTRKNPAKLPLPDISKLPIVNDFNFELEVEEKKQFEPVPFWLPKIIINENKKRQGDRREEQSIDYDIFD